MGKVDAFKVSGCECYFRSEDHDPPHFHVKHKQEGWDIRVFIHTTDEKTLSYDFKIPSGRNKPIDGALEREIRKLVFEHREALMIEHSTKVKS